MNEQTFGRGHGHPAEPQTSPQTGPQTSAETSPQSGQQAQVMASGSKPTVRNETVLGPFTVRDLTVFASTLILFVASLLPMFAGPYNLWNLGSLFFLGLGLLLPLIVTALFAARRLAPETKVRIGSLSVDQFASVVASFAVAFFFLAVAVAFTPSMLVALIGSLILLAATVLARYIPYFAGDFLDRTESPAHVVAREAAAPVHKPRAPKAPKPAKPSPAPSATTHAETTSVSSPYAAQAPPAVASSPEVAGWPAINASPATPAPQAPAVVPAAPAEESADEAAAFEAPAAEVPKADTEPAASEPMPATTVNPQVRPREPIGATVDPASRPEEADHEPAHEAFWFAVAQHRTAIDPRTGAPAFGIDPGGWVLALEDRGHEFLVQHTDGRVGVLRDLSNIERG